MKPESLIDRTLAAARWRFAGQIAIQVLQFLVVLVLARLLPPSVFGLIGTAMIFAELSSFLITEGFSSGIVQQQVITSAQSG